MALAMVLDDSGRNFGQHLTLAIHLEVPIHVSRLDRNAEYSLACLRNN